MEALAELLKAMSLDTLKNDTALLNLCELMISRITALETEVATLQATVARQGQTLKGLIH